MMVGNPLLEPALRDAPDARGHVQNGVVAAIDIGAFTDVERYKEQIDALIQALKALPRAEGTDEIFVPGEPEDRVYDDRIRHGIPLPEGTVRNLRAVAQRFEVGMPV